MNEKQFKETSAEAIMAFVNMNVGAFESGFVDGNKLTIYDMYRSAQNYIKDTFEVDVPNMADAWDEDLVEECREGENHIEVK